MDDCKSIKIYTLEQIKNDLKENALSTQKLCDQLFSSLLYCFMC